MVMRYQMAGLLFASFVMLTSQALAQNSHDWRNCHRLDMQSAEPGAARGDACDQYWVGYMYATGTGLHQDFTEAVRWFRLAAGQGNARAEYWLGSMYEDGDGVQQDWAEAVRWYRLAAEQGYDEAQYKLGELYLLGAGVPQDDTESVRWYRLAAEQGHHLASTMLD